MTVDQYIFLLVTVHLAFDVLYLGLQSVRGIFVDAQKDLLLSAGALSATITQSFLCSVAEAMTLHRNDVTCVDVLLRSSGSVTARRRDFSGILTVLMAIGQIYLGC